LEVIVDRCAALDVHEDTVMACVRKPGGGRRRAQVVREFRTWTSSLRELRDWLADEGVTQATGVYWKPVWHVLVELDQVESRSVIGWWPAGGMLTPAAWPPSSSPRSHRSRKPSPPRAARAARAARTAAARVAASAGAAERVLTPLDQLDLTYGDRSSLIHCSTCARRRIKPSRLAFELPEGRGPLSPVR
jgi:hypothetical protein